MLLTSPYLRNADAALTGLHEGSFTVSFWFKPDSLTLPLTVLLSPHWSVSMGEDGKLTFATATVSSGDVSVVSAEACTSEWNFVVVRYNAAAGGSLTLSLNGVAAIEDAVGGTISTATPLTDAFQIGTADRQDIAGTSAAFDVDEVSVWARALTDAELSALYADGSGSAYPFLGGPFNRVFQGRLINEPQKPLLLGADRSLWAVTQLYDSDTQEFRALLDLIYSGTQVSRGYTWVMDNFTDKIICAQHDNRVQYWTPPSPNVAYDLPGLPTDDAKWDGVTGFTGHVLLWRDDRLKWSAKDDFTLYIPVAETAVSSVLTLADPFVQPPVGGTVAVNIINPVGEVKSISLQGDASYPETLVGETSVGLLTIVNTGTAVLNVTGLTLPPGFTADWTSGAIAVGASQPVVITFAPAEAITYNGIIHVASDATQGTSEFSISGDGAGSTRVPALSGVLAFGRVKKGESITSALVIENRGNSTLTVSGVSLPAGFSGGFSGTIAAGARQAVNITFSPTAAQTYGGLLTVNSNATSGTSSIAVSGSGVASFNKPEAFVTDLGSLQLGDLEVGSTTVGTFRIYNVTGLSFKVIGVTTPAGFATTFSGPVSVPLHDFVDVTVTFTPTDAQTYGGPVIASFNQTVAGSNAAVVVGTGATTGKVIALSGSLAFGEAPVDGSVQALLTIANRGTEDLTVTSITYPTGFSGAFAGTIAPGKSKAVVVSFKPTSATTYTGSLTVNSDKEEGDATYPISGTGFDLPQPVALVAGQVVSLEDTRSGRAYYNYYTVVSMSNTNLVLKLMDLTGATPSGLGMPADGRQFFTVDANEAGETRVTGAGMNGPIYKVVPQGDYAYIFKERSIQSVQYTGLGSGTFFIHNEVNGEGLISREAICDRNDSTLVFLGHRELYAYQGGPNPTPVCQQATRQLFAELDRARVDAVRLFHNENRKEVWVKYPVAGGFRVLVWNYIEDSATFDDYDPSVEFTGLEVVEWSADSVWAQMPEAQTWDALAEAVAWEDLAGGTIDRVPVLATADGNLRVYGRRYARDGAGYLASSETMDFDLGEPDIWKYVDTVVIGLEVKAPTSTPRYMSVQVGTRSALNGYANPPGEDGGIKWTAPKQVLVNGQAPVPVKINPGGAGKYLRVRFSSTDPDVQWRVSSFEVHCRAGGLY